MGHRAELHEAVARNDRQRFSFDEEGTRICDRSHPPHSVEVDAARMAADGHALLVTADGVWLTDAVPPGTLRPHRR